MFHTTTDAHIIEIILSAIVLRIQQIFREFSAKPKEVE